MSTPAAPLRLVPGGTCKTRTGTPHLISSSTEIYVWASGKRLFRVCLHCHREAARKAGAERYAALKAGLTLSEYRETVVARIKAEKLAVAMEAWRHRVHGK